MLEIHDCLTGADCLYNQLLLGTVNDTEDLAGSAVDLELGAWLGPPLGSEDGYGTACSESAFANADSNIVGFCILVSWNIPQSALRMSGVPVIVQEDRNSSDYTESGV